MTDTATLDRPAGDAPNPAGAGLSVISIAKA